MGATAGSFGVMMLLVGTLMYGVYGIVAKLSKDGKHKAPYSTGAVFVLSEFIKLVLSVYFLTEEKSGFGAAFTDIREQTFRGWMELGVPGFIYMCTNNMDVYVLRYMDPGSQQVLTQLKVLTTAILWRIVFKKAIQWVQWGALLMLALGAAMVSWPKDGDVSSE